MPWALPRVNPRSAQDAPGRGAALHCYSWGSIRRMQPRVIIPFDRLPFRHFVLPERVAKEDFQSGWRS